MSNLRDILAGFAYACEYDVLADCHKADVDAACEKVHEVGLSSCGYSGPVLSREWWDDFCSIAKERQEIAGHETRLQCTHCNKGYSTYDKSYRFCPVCGTSLVPQPEPKRESETVDGILNEYAYRDDHSVTKKRLADALLEVFRQAAERRGDNTFSTMGIERVVRETFGQEGK